MSRPLHFDVVVDTKASPSMLIDLFADLERYQVFEPRLSEVEWLPGVTPGRAGSAATVVLQANFEWRLINEHFGQTRGVLVVVQYEQGKRLEFRFDTSLLRAYATISGSDSASSNQSLLVRIDAHLSSLLVYAFLKSLGSFLTPRVSAAIVRAIRRAEDGLKES